MDGLKSDSRAAAEIATAAVRDDASLEADYERCAQITRRSRSSFYYAFILLPPERRRALHAVYAFCRFIDDIADDESIREPALLLKRWREELDRVYAGTPTRALSRALADSAQRFNIPRELFEEIIAGVEMDLSRKRYQSWQELEPYCYRVASALGLICIEIFGYRNPSAKSYAENLGLALQLTNILRDVREDAERGRIYIPLEDLERFKVREEEILGGRVHAELRQPDGLRGPARAGTLRQGAERARARGSRDAADRRGDAPDLRRAARTNHQVELSRARPSPQPVRAAQALPCRPCVGRRPFKRAARIDDARN